MSSDDLMMAEFSGALSVCDRSSFIEAFNLSNTPGATRQGNSF